MPKWHESDYDFIGPIEHIYEEKKFRIPKFQVNSSGFQTNILTHVEVKCLPHIVRCDMAKYFGSRLIYFHEPEVSENKT